MVVLVFVLVVAIVVNSTAQHTGSAGNAPQRGGGREGRSNSRQSRGGGRGRRRGRRGSGGGKGGEIELDDFMS